MSAPDVNAGVLPESGACEPLMIATRRSESCSGDARLCSVLVSCEMSVLLRLLSRAALQIVIVATVPWLPDAEGMGLMSHFISPWADRAGG